MPDEELEAGITVSREGINFIQANGESKFITLEDCCSTQDPVPALLFGCFMGLQDIARASRETSEAIRSATALGEKVSKEHPQNANQMIDQVFKAINSLPNKPEGLDGIMNAIRAAGVSTQ